MQFTRSIPFQEAIDKLGERSVIGSTLRSADWAEVALALRERAYFSSTVESVRVLQRGKDALGDFLAANRETLPTGQTALATGSRQQFVKDVQEFMRAEGIIRQHGGVTDVASQRRLELIFDTQTRAAQDYGSWKQGQYPDVLDEFPAQRFIRLAPVQNPRDSHAPFEDAVRLKSDLDFWTRLNEDFGVPWGPWGWGCGHDVEDVDREEAQALGLIEPGEHAHPVDTDFNDRLAATTRGLDADLQRTLKEAFGDQLVIDGDEARWAGQPKGRVPTNRPDREDKHALADYTDTGYRDLNKSLRAADRSPEVLRKLDALEVALSRLSPFEGMVYRGAVLPGKVLGRILPGNVIREPGFTSASRDFSKAFAGNARFEIQSKTGLNVERWSSLPAEREVMFRHGTAFKVISRELRDGVHHVNLEEL